MKKIIAITTTVLLVICFSTVSAHADRKTMEGFMLGTGVAILGAALINGVHHGPNHHYAPHKTRRHDYRHDKFDRHNRFDRYDRHNDGYRQKYKNKHHKQYSHYNQRDHNHRGHWEIRKEWVGPVYEKRWNPGHYNRKGQWISGRKVIFLVRQGYWQERKTRSRY